jgi:hypothetical protein
MLRVTPGKIFGIVSILKPNGPLTNFVVNFSKLGKNLTTQVNTVTLGGPRTSLDRIYNYSIEKDINFIAESTANINMGSVNLFQRQ